MKRLFTCLLPVLLFASLTACGVQIEIPLSPPEGPDVVFSEEKGPLSEGVPEDAGSEETPDDAGPEEAPEDGVSGLDDFPVSAPSYAIYPEVYALENLSEDGTYTSKDDVALYIYGYGHLPDNFITKKEARDLGWSGGGLDAYAPGMCIGGDRFGNYEGVLPDVEGRTYYECDIDTLHASSRGAKRLVFCWGDGEDHCQVYYTKDHYETFEMVYGDDDPDTYG